MVKTPSGPMILGQPPPNLRALSKPLILIPGNPPYNGFVIPVGTSYVLPLNG